MAKILIAVPHGGAVEPETLVSIYNMDIPEGVETELRLLYAYSIEQGRNMVSKQAIEQGFTHVLFVDADMELPRNSLSSMISRGKDIVSGGYVKKQAEKSIAAFRRSPQTGRMDAISETEFMSGGLVRVDAVGFGCALVTTSCLSRVGYPQFKYMDDADPKKSYGEDVFFCIKAASVYYGIFLDCEVRCGHIGRKKYTI